MLDMATHSIRLFLAGKLFRDNAAFFKQWAIGVLVTLALIVLLGLVHPWLGAIVGSLAGGAAMPWLYKDLKYN